MEKICNIIIAGIGGHGVFTLSNVLRSLCAKSGYQCQGATFKGGAQRLGSIHSELRIVFDKEAKKNIFSSVVAKGSLDLLIGLEPWEALRFAIYCNKKTKVICNSHKQALYVERYKSEKIVDPLPELQRIFKDLNLSDFTLSSVSNYGNEKMVNYLILKQIIDEGVLPFNWQQAKEEFSLLTAKTKK